MEPGNTRREEASKEESEEVCTAVKQHLSQATTTFEISSSINHHCCYRVPSTRKLKPGQLQHSEKG